MDVFFWHRPVHVDLAIARPCAVAGALEMHGNEIGFVPSTLRHKLGRSAPSYKETIGKPIVCS